MEATQNAGRGEVVVRAVDRAVTARWPAAVQRASRARGATVEERVMHAQRGFVRELTVVGAAAGATAAVPGVGTAAGVAVAGGELAIATTRSADLILTIAAIHGLEAASVEERRAWVLSVMLFGETASRGFSRLAGDRTFGSDLLPAASRATTAYSRGSRQSLRNEMSDTAPDPLPEFRDVLADEPLSQGDILHSISEREDYRLVVTADCDLARGKHGGRLSVIPILGLDEYILEFWSPRRRAPLVQSLLDRVTKRLRKLQDENRPEFPIPISAERSREWLQTAPTSEILETLGATTDTDTSGLASGIELYQSACSAPPENLVDLFIEDAQLRRAVGQQSDQASAHKALHERIVNDIRSLPGDAFFVGAIAQGHNGGYVCHLRLLDTIDPAVISLGGTDRTNLSEFERVSRLRAPYLFALTQQLAAVFSAIGLSTEYEENRRLVVDARLQAATQEIGARIQEDL